ncbi:IclR family transcriptional regulator [Nocardioides albertanoniae]|uniref:IclR family transcriptional regulator n=1 Tax=Nocardioides albertanoniae TaxID=1175486 RepID=A0A543AAD5_9ACTN|nr:helix-turn-helix domain-containing protein [Nocardioides albertanoniae]TQL69426.1 IclR family transcriptional regulator [Nocardioides albertanoniae]
MHNEQPDLPKSGRDQDIQAVTRTAQILGLFSPERPELSVADATELLGLNRTTVHRYFSSMIRSGLLERIEQSASVRPGRSLLQLGAFALGQRRILLHAPTYLRELAREVEVSTVLSLWGSSGPVISLVEEDANHATLVTVRVGTQLSLTSSQAKVFLAFLPDQLAAERLTGALPEQQRNEVREQIQTVREVGISSDVSHRGICIIAAPVFDERGLCAAVAAIGTERMLPDSLDSRQALAVKTTCQRLTKEMGGTWPSEVA